MLITEYRIILPLSLPEYNIGYLYGLMHAAKSETGGGNGLEILVNSPFTNMNLFQQRYYSGQYTHWLYHLHDKVPKFVRLLAPKGSLTFHEQTWNAYPEYVKTVVTNPDYMKEHFFIKVDTVCLADRGTSDNVHKLNEEELKKREIVYIDIANDPTDPSDYLADEDPKQYHSTKANRGPLTGNWTSTCDPVMCAYKLVRCEFQWFGLQTRVEQLIMRSEHRLFTRFNRQVFCTMDQWFGMTIEQIRQMEKETKTQLDSQRLNEPLKGSAINESNQ